MQVIPFIICMLPPCRTSDLRLRGHPFQLPDYYTDLLKINRLLFDLCMDILNKIVNCSFSNLYSPKDIGSKHKHKNNINLTK